MKPEERAARELLEELGAEWVPGDLEIATDALRTYGESEHQRGAARVRAMEEALRELVILKDGPRDADYEKRKPLAWQVARDVLAGTPNPSSEYQRGRRDAGAEWSEAADAAMQLLMMFPVDAMGFHRAGEVAIALRALLAPEGER